MKVSSVSPVREMSTVKRHCCPGRAGSWSITVPGGASARTSAEKPIGLQPGVNRASGSSASRCCCVSAGTSTPRSCTKGSGTPRDDAVSSATSATTERVSTLNGSALAASKKVLLIQAKVVTAFWNPSPSEAGRSMFRSPS